MLRFLRMTAVLCLIAVSVHAQRAFTIAGGIYEDHTALAQRPAFKPAASVTVQLYRDGGDRAPSADDTLVDTARTDTRGTYVLNARAAGDHWVVVDSSSLGAKGTWAEQTFGPAGALCAQLDGSSRFNFFEGPCFGGRTAASDNASVLTTAEHVALVRDASTRVDFAFSYDVVTSVADGDGIQGSLRQFVLNANTVSGPNRMRFVPLAPATERRESSFGVPPKWWVITLLNPLPELRDADTVIDGTAYNILSPASVQNIHPGGIGESPTIQPNERLIPRLQKPELELQLTGAEGIVCSARCGVRAIAIHGATIAFVARADARLEHVLAGAAPDGLPSETMGSVGMQIEQGTTIARHVLATMQSRAGILVGHEARIDGERLEVTRCGDPQTGAGIVLLSDGSSIRASTIAANAGVGIIIGTLDGSVTANGNTIDGSAISSNQGGVILGPGSSRNVVARNDFMWNRLGGVAVAPFQNTPPQDNRVSANRFDENGLRPIILELDVDDPNALMKTSSTCAQTATAANNGIEPPRLTSVRVSQQETTSQVTIRGRACPGQVVELYRAFVTAGVREESSADLPLIRSGETEEDEAGTASDRVRLLPSIGEFNYLGSANTAADGSFEATFPLPVVHEIDIQSQTDEEDHVWASEVLRGARAEDRAFAAIAIDATGNTSEMSVRRRVD